MIILEVKSLLLLLVQH